MHNCFKVFGVALVLSTSAPAEAADVSVTGGWFRSLPSGRPAGGYFTMHNGGAAPVELVAAESTGCGMLMLHQTVSTGGTSRMDDVKSVSIPAGGKVSFAPGGYHLMCMNPGRLISPGKIVPVTFVFSDGGKVHTSFAVKNAAGR